MEDHGRKSFKKKNLDQVEQDAYEKAWDDYMEVSDRAKSKNSMVKE
jgi:hypothetical protein